MVTISLTEGVPWKFRQAGTRKWRAAEVPGCVHRDLRRHKVIPDPFFGRNEHEIEWISDRAWEYRCVFEISSAWLHHEQIDLCADGLDTIAIVRLNGHVVLRSNNMFVGHRVPIRTCLRPGRNELSVVFESATRYIARVRQRHQPREINDPVGGCTRIRKQQCQFGWDWGPRLITAGIWRDLRIEAWSDARLRDVRITQRHSEDGSVLLQLAPEIEHTRGVRDLHVVARLIEDANASSVAVSEVRSVAARPLAIRIAQPQLWWPNGQGASPLYRVEVELWSGETRLDLLHRRIGLRTLKLERKRDRWGETFQFVVNGRPLFAKGASWIPAHQLTGGLTRAHYEPALRSAAAANMNMIRVWGGGIYEHECFYDLCDELGLLVWHDFMFACTLYPGDREFLASVRAEAEYQVRRLRHRACLALWCGNNELESLNGPDLKQRAKRKDYDAVFRRILPKAVARFDGVTSYWRSSPSQGDGPGLGDPTRSGNCHYWDVWHLLKPVRSYEQSVFRFVAEFGMQSFPSENVARTFCPPEQLNIFSPVMESHQKNPVGNRVILEYVSRRYRFPKDYASLAYLSQLNQAYCMQVGVEHFRRHQPRCMGALYWQLNDCWPAVSWSSLEFGGRWKALHYAARRFYAPLLASAHVLGDETTGIGNRTRSTVTKVILYTISDAPEVATGLLEWELHRLDGKICFRGQKKVRLRPGESRAQKRLDLGAPIKRFGRERLYLRVALVSDGRCVSEDTVFLCPPRCLELARVAAEITREQTSPRSWRLTMKSPSFQHRVALDLAGIDGAEFSDNWFDLYPGRSKQVTITLPNPASDSLVRRSLRHRSLVDSYA